jgi:hypothetical protein
LAEAHFSNTECFEQANMPGDEIAMNDLEKIKPISEKEMRERIKQSPAFRTDYYNHSRIAPSFFDVRIFLGQSSITPSGEQLFEESQCVILSAECAKVIANGLVQAISVYEKTFGPIRTGRLAAPVVTTHAKEKNKKAKIQ